jgi:hypothetical protein
VVETHEHAGDFKEPFRASKRLAVRQAHWSGWWFTSAVRDVANGMSKYFSDKPIWFERTAKIDALNGKELLLIRADHIDSANLRVESAAPNSPQHGKVCVVAWNIIVSDEPDEKIEIMPTKAPKYAEIGRYERFLTQDALDSIRPHTARLLGGVEIELVIEDEEESSPR